jgi:hypothetical protein
MSPEALAEIVVTTIKAALAPVRADLARLEGTLAALEARPLVPGPPGRDGRDGAAGADGAHGADGLGFDQLSATYQGDRTLALTFTTGTAAKTIPIVLTGLPVWQGTYVANATYEPGDLVNWGGSTWICKACPPGKPGEGATGWQLMVKRGRDGRDGKA